MADAWLPAIRFRDDLAPLRNEVTEHALAERVERNSTACLLTVTEDFAGDGREDVVRPVLGGLPGRFVSHRDPFDLGACVGPGFLSVRLRSRRRALRSGR